ncbi:MAG: bifunctional diaminohydroxyphosphoribosylaminopyrimidine deaminase/5-amino-6-(5-phosphoribosylamino)uracil reductase RibD [Chitinophagaceae bacterium]|nr:bifunctional diaminohydroxyphosphoribosylaminopyrimidine deaminase/5-amino-6-(5-phosphoribosylamino)uracil reductase RibD [Chitinophagaceae bacterium]
MHRCLELAKLGRGSVAPNPMVGALLVHDDQIIGEGYHKAYGGPHAEVNAVSNAIDIGNEKLLQESTMYVNLEPCSHFGRTPPCSDLIIRHKIPRVVIGSRDPFPEVDGKGIEKLQAAGLKVKMGVLEGACKELNKRFFSFQTLKRPYIILKWAETANRMISAGEGKKRLMISNDYSNFIVHKWRGEEVGIMVGTNTALGDNPSLTTRFWPGRSPVRIVVDLNLRLPSSLKIFDEEGMTIVFNSRLQTPEEDWPTNFAEKGRVNPLYYQVNTDEALIRQVAHGLYRLNIQSILVEGGARLLESFIDEGLWDEARVIRNTDMNVEDGLAAPELSKMIKVSEQTLFTDVLEIYKPVH